MTNHVHLVAVPEDKRSMEQAIGYTHRRFSRWINRRFGWVGHLWGNRFYSSPMDEAHLWAAVRYVETNPLRAELVEEATDYRWSSARAHCGLEYDRVLAGDDPFPGAIRDWRRWLHQKQDAQLVQQLRAHTSTGRPSGSKEFIERLEARLDRHLSKGRPGPQRSR